jgi:hypothetical protein
MAVVDRRMIAGTAESLLATRTPATNVPCLQAALLDRAQLPPLTAGSSRMLSLSKSGRPIATGPSIKPIATSGRPAVRAISGESVTSFKEGRHKRSNFPVPGNKQRPVPATTKWVRQLSLAVAAREHKRLGSKSPFRGY